MTVSSDIVFSINNTYDDKLMVSAAVDQPAGSYIARSAISDIPHNNGLLVPHPTIEGLIRSGENHFLTEGSWTHEYDCIDGYTAEQRANFEAWVASNDEGVRDQTGSTVTYDSVNNKYTVAYTCEFGSTSWRQIPTKWAPHPTAAKFTLGENSTVLCVLRIDDDPYAWTLQYKDIPSGTTSTIDKAGTTCYVIFSKDVTKDGTTLNAFQAYTLDSASFDVNAANDTKVFRFYLE